VPAVHVRPFGFSVVQLPASQYGRPCPAAMHWPSSVQAPRQSLPAHPCVQGIMSMAAQEPRPSHPAACVFTPALQVCSRQLVVAGGNLHAVLMPPPHSPSHSPVPPHGPRVPCGGPRGTREQVPSSSATSHASHWPVQVLLQQRPSTQ
jgi:hypothetical protein